MNKIYTKKSSNQTMTESGQKLATLINRALLAEIHLTPKPGLVDLVNTGSHNDMDVSTFERSINAIVPWMEKFFTLGYITSSVTADKVLDMLRPSGMACENDMLEATSGVNTHRGVIFLFGLLSAAAGRLLSRKEPLEQGRLCDTVAMFCRGIVSRELARPGSRQPEESGVMFQRYGVTGARGEAESGFRTVRTIALPVLRRVTEECSDNNLALLQTLLHLLAWNDDTRLISRGGLEGLHYVQHQAQLLLWKGGVMTKEGVTQMQELDKALISRNLSPGGSADLLAVAWFLNHFPAGKIFP